MLFHESLDLLHVHSVVGVRVPFECWCVNVGVSEACRCRILLILHIVVRHSWELATLPREVSDVEGVVEWPEEEHAVCNKRELIDVPQLHRVLCFDHININYNYKFSNNM